MLWFISRRAPPEGGYAKEQRAQRMATPWNTKNDGCAMEYRIRWLRKEQSLKWTLLRSYKNEKSICGYRIVYSYRIVRCK